MQPVRFARLAMALALAPLCAQSQSSDLFNPDADGPVLALALQADGKLLVGGAFGSLGGQPRSNLGRLQAVGSLDTGFNPGADGMVQCLAVQADGRVLVGGQFSVLAAQRAAYLGRLNAEGTLDTTFNPQIGSIVRCLAVQPDGKILVGGDYGVVGAEGLGRLNPDGTLDPSFNAGATNCEIMAVALQPDGKVLVGGFFALRQHLNLARLNSDGSLDSSFSANANGTVQSIALQADGRILVGGSFTAVSSMADRLVRLNSDGTVDSSFRANVQGDPSYSVWVDSLALQADGKILLGGNFNSIGGQPRRSLARLNPDGTLDWSFDPRPLGRVDALGIGSDGTLAIGGAFDNIGGQSQTNLARVSNTGSATQNLSFDGSTVTWMRGGTGPEVWRTTFEYSPDGISWNALGGGSRIPGGWQLAGLNLPSHALFRARGYAPEGIVEAISGPLAIITQPASVTNNAGSAARFEVLTRGDGPLSYQWRKNAVNLTDGANLFGSATATLTITNLTALDAAGYSVVLSNTFGNLTSTVATLSVIDPAIIVQPRSQDRNPGEGVTFNPAAAGTPPLQYQWLKNGAILPGATHPFLVLTNLQGTDAGAYQLAVENSQSSVTSAVAVLRVNLAQRDNFAPAEVVINGLALQPDGRIVVAGTVWDGKSWTHIPARLNADGTVDTTFRSTVDQWVTALALWPDRTIAEAASAGALSSIIKLNRDGALAGIPNSPLDGSVYSLALQPDGKMIVAGVFSSLAGQARTNIARLNPDGTLDPAFRTAAEGSIYRVVLQPDGKIVVGGYFGSLNGQSRSNLARLDGDGTLDMGFNPQCDGSVWSLILQPDGKILVAGNFNVLDGESRPSVGRLNADGSLDRGFQPLDEQTQGLVAREVYSLALQADGKIILGGQTEKLAGVGLQFENYAARLNPDGSPDLIFNPSLAMFDAIPYFVIQPDGKILAYTQDMLVRFQNPDPAIEHLSAEGSTVTWLRAGAVAEIWRASFEFSCDGISWTPLGEGLRIPGGWQLSGVSLPPKPTVRARGYVAQDNSLWFTEQVIGLPVVVTPPADLTSDFAATATFNVFTQGDLPQSYQWLKNGRPLTNGGTLQGVDTTTLTLTNVTGADAAGYSVIVANAQGSVTSAAATLTVNDPLVTLQPLSQNKNIGDGVVFTVGAVGTPPLAYQWRKDRLPIAGATESSLTLANLAGRDAGTYDAVVKNMWGAAMSAGALLSINTALPDAFDPQASGGDVLSLAVQPDGKIVAGGNFTTLAGQLRLHLGRLNSDGTLDTIFSGVANDTVFALAIQTDRKILVGGTFTSLAGQPCAGLGRLNADGSFDPTFKPPLPLPAWVYSLALQPDGKVFAAGDFQLFGRTNLARFNAGGSLDTSFTPVLRSQAVYAPTVLSLALQPDGKVLVGGYFGAPWTPSSALSKYDAVWDSVFLDRLNSDGSRDPSFSPQTSIADAGHLQTLAVQPDGKILEGGNFSDGFSGAYHIRRLNTDGTLDLDFDTMRGIWWGGVASLALRADGEFFAGGGFTTLAGQVRTNIGALNLDGTVDPKFNPALDGFVNALALQPDGNLLLAGGFTNVENRYRSHIARINIGSVTNNLIITPSTITWLLGGAAPGVWRTTFEYSTDGASWLELGPGTPVAGGWQKTGLNLPPDPIVRARGFTTGGNGNASTWFIEAVWSPVLAISDFARSSGGLLQFNEIAPPGQVAVVESSPDLVNWTPLGTNTIGNGTLEFTYPEPGNSSVRFYRLRGLP